MKGEINAERGECRLNRERDINGKEQKEKIRGKIREEIQQQ